MWTFWYHEPDENKIFNNCHYVKMFTVDNINDIDLVLSYFRKYHWLKKGIYSVTCGNQSPKMEDHLEDTTISFVAFWEHRKTHETLCIDVFESLVKHFCEHTLLNIDSEDIVCVRSTPKPNERCAFNIWVHNYPVNIVDCRNIINSKFKNEIQEKIYWVKKQNGFGNPFQVKNLNKKFVKTENQFSMIMANCPALK